MRIDTDFTCGPQAASRICMDRVADKILIVDTDEETRNLVSEYLGDLGHECHFQSDPKLAIDTASRRHFDFVVASDRIQGLSPVDFIRKIHSVSPDIFIIFVSSRSEIAHELRGIHSRFRRMEPPLVLEDLARRIRLCSQNTEAG